MIPAPSKVLYHKRVSEGVTDCTMCVCRLEADYKKVLTMRFSLDEWVTEAGMRVIDSVFGKSNSNAVSQD